MFIKRSKWLFNKSTFLPILLHWCDSWYVRRNIKVKLRENGGFLKNQEEIVILGI